MMYPFLSYPDGTAITHSEMQPDETVKVYVETPDERDGFHNAWCILPQYEWKDVNGYSECEISKYQEIIESVAHLIIEFSQEGGFDNASNF
jgi:hypothetical protein